MDFLYFDIATNKYFSLLLAYLNVLSDISYFDITTNIIDIIVSGKYQTKRYPAKMSKWIYFILISAIVIFLVATIKPQKSNWISVLFCFLCFFYLFFVTFVTIKAKEPIRLSGFSLF